MRRIWAPSAAPFKKPPASLWTRIPGLYATGNCCGGRFGLQYSTPVSGISISIAQTMGMVAGEHLAALPRRDFSQK